jgi:F-type H+-transporting ATPase subunit delta
VELTTIAKPYANAIFKIAQQDQSHTDWKSVLEVGALVANDATMRDFVASPNATKADKMKAMTAVFTSALDRALSKQENVFVTLLLDNGRISVLPNILTLFDALSNQNSDARTFHVISAYQLSKKEEDNIVKDLSDKYQTTVSIDTQIDDNLVGGIVIKEGDKVIDLSIQARVNALGSILSVA